MVTRREFFQRSGGLAVLGAGVVLPTKVGRVVPSGDEPLSEVERLNHFVAKYHPSVYRGRSGLWLYGFTGFKTSLVDEMIGGQYVVAYVGKPEKRYFYADVNEQDEIAAEFRPGETFMFKGLPFLKLIEHPGDDFYRFALNLVDESKRRVFAYAHRAVWASLGR